jgi:hypothetical protein
MNWRSKANAITSAVTRPASAFGRGQSESFQSELRRSRQALRRTRRELRAANEKLREARGHIREGEVDLAPDVVQVIRRVREEHLTYLREPNLRDLAALVRDLERNQVPGLIIEAGTARGGSAIVMAAAKDVMRPMKVYDVFGMIPPPTDRDGEDVHKRYGEISGGAAKGVGGDQYYGYRDDLYSEVLDSFERMGVPIREHHVELVKGLFQDTIDLDQPVALAHLDGDWYESTMTCLQRIAPLVSPGGRIVLDDYYAWSGCRRAVDEYFRDNHDFELEFRAKVHAVRA